MSLQQTFDCDHPVALVTGSVAPRVGLAIAKRLATLGCQLAIHGRTSSVESAAAADQLRRLGAEVLPVTAALEDPEAVAAMVSDTVGHFGRLDVLVNSAAIWRAKQLEQVTAADVREYFDVNAIAVFIAAQAAGLQMISQPSGGAIVNISDWATSRPYLDHAAYFPSKGAVEAMTRSLAVELAHRNPRVRVNCIQPGPVLLAESVDHVTRAAIAQNVLLKRIGTPDSIAHAVQFLVENEFVTGVILPVDGGRRIYADDGLQNGLNTG